MPFSKGLRYLRYLRHKIDHANPKTKRAFYTKQNYYGEIISECLLLILLIALIILIILLWISSVAFWTKFILSSGALLLFIILMMLIVACGYDIHLMNLYKAIRGFSNKK